MHLPRRMHHTPTKRLTNGLQPEANPKQRPPLPRSFTHDGHRAPRLRRPPRPRPDDHTVIPRGHTVVEPRIVIAHDVDLDAVDTAEEMRDRKSTRLNSSHA